MLSLAFPPPRSRRAHLRAGALATTAATLLTGLVAGLALAQDLVEGETSDGARYLAPAEWTIGTPLAVSGTGWTTLSGEAGSTIAVLYDRGSVLAPNPIEGDDEIWARIVAEPDGSWTAELPYPEDAGWAAGETHTVHLLSGSLGDDDRARSGTVTLLIVE